MSNDSASLEGMDLERRPGRRSGCSCCSLTMLGMMAFPLLAIVAVFVAL